MVLTDGKGTPLAARVHSASPAEVKLIPDLIDAIAVPDGQPQRLIYDKAADSDDLREELDLYYDIELICPHRRGRKRPARQDGRKLRRYKRRWKIERSIAWLKNFRRVATRYDHSVTHFLAGVQIACLFTTLQRF